MERKRIYIALVVAALVAAPLAAEQKAAAALRQPVLITSIGQSSGAMMAKVLATKANLHFVYEQRAKIAALETAKTLVVVLGVSSKGLGAAGVDVEAEVAWGNELYARAKQLGIPVVAMHIEGAVRRGAGSDRICSLFGEKADLLVVKAAGNEDGLFTKMAAAKGIPLHLVDATLDVVPILQKLFPAGG